jgi:flagellar protein FlbT
MPLRFDLGPNERVFIGKSVLTNGANRTKFVIEGDTPILRSRDVLSPGQAVNAPEKLYCCVQQVYLEEDMAKYHASYLVLMAQAISEFPDYYADLQAVEGLIEGGQHYRALKELKIIIDKNSNSLGGSEPRGSFAEAPVRAHN